MYFRGHHGRSPLITDDELTRTPRYLRLLADAEELARSLGHGYVGAEHLFLAIIRDRDAMPTQVLSAVIDPGYVAATLLHELDTSSGPTRCELSET